MSGATPAAFPVAALNRSPCVALRGNLVTWESGNGSRRQQQQPQLQQPQQPPPQQHALITSFAGSVGSCHQAVAPATWQVVAGTSSAPVPKAGAHPLVVATPHLQRRTPPTSLLHVQSAPSLKPAAAEASQSTMLDGSEIAPSTTASEAAVVRSPGGDSLRSPRGSDGVSGFDTPHSGTMDATKRWQRRSSWDPKQQVAPPSGSDLGEGTRAGDQAEVAPETEVPAGASGHDVPAAAPSCAEASPPGALDSRLGLSSPGRCLVTPRRERPPPPSEASSALEAATDAELKDRLRIQLEALQTDVECLRSPKVPAQRLRSEPARPRSSCPARSENASVDATMRLRRDVQAAYPVRPAPQVVVWPGGATVRPQYQVMACRPPPASPCPFPGHPVVFPPGAAPAVVPVTTASTAAVSTIRRTAPAASPAAGPAFHALACSVSPARRVAASPLIRPPGARARPVSMTPAPSSCPTTPATPVVSKFAAVAVAAPAKQQQHSQQQSLLAPLPSLPTLAQTPLSLSDSFTTIQPGSARGCPLTTSAGALEASSATHPGLPSQLDPTNGGRSRAVSSPKGSPLSRAEAVEVERFVAVQGGPKAEPEKVEALAAMGPAEADGLGPEPASPAAEQVMLGVGPAEAEAPCTVQAGIGAEPSDDAHAEVQTGLEAEPATASHPGTLQ